MMHSLPRRVLHLAVPLLLTLGAAAAAAQDSPGGDQEAGRDKSRICAGCHGPEGTGTMPRYPNLAGQHQPYLEKAITAYRDGGRQDPEMSPMAASLSDQDIRDLATFYSNQSCCTE